MSKPASFADQLRNTAEQAFESLSDGWRELASKAGGALTRFRRTPTSDEGGDAGDNHLPALGRWAYMAADILDEDDKVIVRLEAPGLRREDFKVELHGRRLSVHGEKRVDPTSSLGSRNVVQCAYGAFRREIALPDGVQADRVQASYRDGVLRVELPKAEGTRSTPIEVAVD